MADLFRTPDERFANMPGYDFEPHWHDTDGLRMHYLDEGSGDPIVCFHGEPTLGLPVPEDGPGVVRGGPPSRLSHYPGFDRSDKPTSPGWYSYDRFTVVVQDWGGPIGLRWAVETPSAWRAL